MGGGAAFGPVTWSHGTDDYVAGLAWGGDDRLAAATLGGTVTVLDGADGSVVTKLPDHPLGALAVAWSPDGRLLASGGHDGIARIVDGATGATRGELSGRGWVGAVAWRPDGGLLAAAIGRTVSLLDPDGTVVLTSEPVASTITSVVWSADGRRVGVGCYGGVSWYEVERGSSPVKHFAWKGSVLSLAVSPDGRWLTGGAQDQTVHIWRLWSADDLEMSGYPTKVEHLSWHHSSKRMAVGNLGEITIWDFSGRGPGGRRPRQLEGHERHISALAFQHGGDLLASGGADGRLLLWDGTSRSSSPSTASTTSEGPSPDWPGQPTTATWPSPAPTVSCRATRSAEAGYETQRVVAPHPHPTSSTASSASRAAAANSTLSTGASWASISEAWRSQVSEKCATQSGVVLAQLEPLAIVDLVLAGRRSRFPPWSAV